MKMMDGLSDVTLVLKDKREFRASRNVLSAASPFFSALLNSNMRENKEGIIRLEYIADTVMKDVLQFTLSGRVEITPTNVQDLIVTADYLLLPNLKTVAGRFLKGNMTISNCISIYYFAEKYRCEEHVIKAFILSNFDVVAKSEEFLNLECQQVEEWISSDEIAISSEKEVINIILNWAEQKENERKGKLEDLFRHVRFSFVSRDYLKDVVTNHLVTENSSCLRLVKDAMKKVHCATDNDIPPPGRDWQHNHLVVLAGNQTLCYDPNEEKWYRMGNALRDYRQVYDLLSFKGHLHVFLRYENFSQSERYDTLCDRWVSLDLRQSHLMLGRMVEDSPWSHCRRFTTVLGTEMYAIDYTGMINQTPKCHIMKYNVESDSWQRVSSLQYDETWQGEGGACVVAMDNYLYVIGGKRDGTGAKHLFRPTAHAVRFNTIRLHWETIASMQCARYSACCVAARGKIFIAGGISRDALRYVSDRLHPNDITQTCEMYNVFTNEWQFIASLQKPRWQGSMVYLKGSLYVVGGKRFSKDQIAENALDVDSYDFESNSWKPKTKIPVLSRDTISKWNIKACTLTVCDQVLTRPITRFQFFKGWITSSVTVQ